MYHLPPVATPFPLSLWLKTLRQANDVHQPLQTAFSHFLGGASCFFASSGRTAFALLLQAMLQQAKDRSTRREIILPAYTCPALAKVIIDVGLRPRLVDIEPTTFAYVSDHLAATLSEQTLAVVIVHPFGLPVPVSAILAQTHQVGAWLIEDAAQSLGAMRDGQPVGTLGDVGLFSLGPGKPISAGGGGVMCVNDRQLMTNLERIWQDLPPASPMDEVRAIIRLAALTAAFHPVGWWFALRAGANRMGDDKANWGYHLSRLTAVQARVALQQLPHLAAYNQARREKAEAMLSRLQGVPGILPPILENASTATPIYLRLPLLVTETARRDRLLRALNQAGIGVGRMYKRTLAEFFPQLEAVHYPGAEQVAAQLITLPTHHFVTKEKLRKIIEIVQNTQSNDILQDN